MEKIKDTPEKFFELTKKKNNDGKTPSDLSSPMNLVNIKKIFFNHLIIIQLIIIINIIIIYVY